jgi:hypothetical protein
MPATLLLAPPDFQKFVRPCILPGRDYSRISIQSISILGRYHLEK